MSLEFEQRRIAQFFENLVFNCLQLHTLIHKYLNSKILISDGNLQIPSCNFVRMDHPSNEEHAVVCLYYKCPFPLKVIDVSYLQECINFDAKIGDEICNFLSFYRSPSQTKDEFDNFVKSLELNLVQIVIKSLFLIVVIL